MGAKTIIYIVAAAVIAVLVGGQLGAAGRPGRAESAAWRAFRHRSRFCFSLFAGIILLLDLTVHALREYAWRRERRALATQLEAAVCLPIRKRASRTGALKATLQSELADDSRAARSRAGDTSHGARAGKRRPFN